MERKNEEEATSCVRVTGRLIIKFNKGEDIHLLKNPEDHSKLITQTAFNGVLLPIKRWIKNNFNIL